MVYVHPVAVHGVMRIGIDAPSFPQGSASVVAGTSTGRTPEGLHQQQVPGIADAELRDLHSPPVAESGAGVPQYPWPAGDLANVLQGFPDGFLILWVVTMGRRHPRNNTDHNDQEQAIDREGLR